MKTVKREEAADDEEAALCDLHFIANCQSCSNWTQAEEDAAKNDDQGDWLSHKLSFAQDRLGKDLEWKRKNEEELMVVDPREKAKELGVKMGGEKRGWDKRRDGERKR